MGLADITNVQVEHCKQAYGVAVTGRSRIARKGSRAPTTSSSSSSNSNSNVNGKSKGSKSDFEDGFKLVYSGDTRPCANLVAVGRNATILIHEATFDDNKMAEAVAKRHSTVSEAMSIGQRMNAYRIILTHFSQRYPSVPPLVASGAAKALLAFDFMHVSFRDLLWAPAIMPAMAEAFPPALEDEDPDDDDIEDVKAELKGGEKGGKKKNEPQPQNNNKNASQNSSSSSSSKSFGKNRNAPFSRSFSTTAVEEMSSTSSSSSSFSSSTTATATMMIHESNQKYSMAHVVGAFARSTAGCNCDNESCLLKI